MPRKIRELIADLEAAGFKSRGGKGPVGALNMPEVSRFFGISIRMYFDDHNPPHFHAIYAGAETEIGIDPVTILRGRFPRRALGMVLEWAATHQQELLDNWAQMQRGEAPQRIDPLD